MGFPVEIIGNDSAKDTTMADLAGNTFSTSVVLAVLFGIYANVDMSVCDAPETCMSHGMSIDDISAMLHAEAEED